MFDVVELDGANITRVMTEGGGREEYAKCIESMVERTMTPMHEDAYRSDKRYDGIIELLMPAIREATRKLIRAFVSGAPMVIRYHNDGDGASGAIAIYRLLSRITSMGLCGDRQVSWQMNRSVFYTLEAFYTDKMLFEAYKSAEPPLLLISDFGTGLDSAAAITSASEVSDILWIDHHVIPEGFDSGRSTYINPFLNGGDSSLSAGFICAVLSGTFGAESKDLGEAALISDYSLFANRVDKNAERIALVLDYLTAERQPGEKKPRQMNEIISDAQEMDRVYHLAESKLDSAIKSGMKDMKRYQSPSGANVQVIDFRATGISGGYPPPGRYTSKMQYLLEEKNGGKTITIVHYGNSISIRVSRDITKETDILRIISKIQSEAPGEINGGGHMEAASIRASYGSSKNLLSMLLNEMGITP